MPNSVESFGNIQSYRKSLAIFFNSCVPNMGGVEEQVASGAAPSEAILTIINEGVVLEMGEELTIYSFFHDLG